MQYSKHQQLRGVATVHASHGPFPTTRAQRLARWAEVLERTPSRQLTTLSGTEFEPFWVRRQIRQAGSPLSIAFEDPVLEGAGLAGDTYGDARQFFGLSHAELHHLVCNCHHGATVQAHLVANGIRRLRSRPRRPLWESAFEILFGRRATPLSASANTNEERSVP